MYELSEDSYYQVWAERSVISDCMKDIGLKDLSSKVMNPSTSGELINKLLSILKHAASAQKRHDVLERLHFAGLIYG